MLNAEIHRLDLKKDVSMTEKMKVVYYPGCTLHEKASELDLCARNVAKELGIELVDLPSWTCCGAAFPLSKDNVMGMVAAARILSNARKYSDKITTLCSFCYNVLKRVNYAIQTDEEKRTKINEFLELAGTPEGIYKGEVKVIHYIEMLQEYGFDNIRKKVKNPLKLSVAPYYGCQLLRPEKELHFDSADRPKIFEKLIEATGAKVIDFPYKTECCGSYHILRSPDAAHKCTYSILNNAANNGADAVATTCPLCYFNMETEQGKVQGAFSGMKPLPVFYFTELLSIALGINCNLTRHTVDIGDIINKCAGVKT
jgi:heterodisulfide reductase subunit B